MFTNNLLLRDAGDGKTFFVAEAFEYHYSRTTHVRVHKEFRTDLASIPRLGRIFIPKLGKFNQSSVCHDYLYQVQKIIRFEYKHGMYQGQTEHVSRKEADKIFLAAMKTAGVRWTRRRAIYLTVRAAGWAYWKRCSDC